MLVIELEPQVNNYQSYNGHEGDETQSRNKYL